MVVKVKCIIARRGIDAIVFLIVRAHEQGPTKRLVPIEAEAQTEFVPHTARIFRAGNIVECGVARQVPPGEAIAEAIIVVLPIGAIQVSAIQVAIARPNIPALVLARFRGNEIDRAPGRVAAIQRALRAFQNFHTGKIIQHQARLDVGRQIDAIGIDRSGGGRQGLMVNRADAANLEGDLRTVCDSGLNPGQQVSHVLGTDISIRQRQIPGINHADGHRNVCQRRGARGGGGDDRVQPVHRVIGLGRGWEGKSEEGERGD